MFSSSGGRRFSVATGLNVMSNSGNDEQLTPEETASISVPSTILNLLPNNSENVNLIFAVYSDSRLFPVRTNYSSNISNEQAVGSKIISFSVPGIEIGTELPNPVNISLRLTNPMTGSAEVSHFATINIFIYN